MIERVFKATSLCLFGYLGIYRNIYVVFLDLD